MFRFSGASYAIGSYFTYGSWEKVGLSGALKAAFWGAVSGAVTFGIRECFTTAKGVATAFSKIFGGVLVKAAAHGISQGTLAMMQNNGAGFLSGASGGFFGSLGATAWGGAGGKWGGIGGKYARSSVGTVAFGSLSGGVGAELSGGNFWKGAVTGGIVSGLNHYGHQQQVKSEIEEKFPGLIKAMSKIRSYLKNNDEAMKSFTGNSGYSKSQALKIFTLRNLIGTVKVTPLSDYGEFRSNDSKNVFIDKYLATSLDKGGYVGLGGSRTSLIGTEFLAGVTIMHEFVHQGRFINGLSNKIGRYEAGQYFETAAFGQVNYSSTVDGYVKRSGW